VLDNLAAQSDPDHVLLINTGNDFRPGTEPEKRRAAVMFKAFSLMGVDCLALSEREFVFGSAYLQSLAAKSSVPLVCANLKDTNARGSYFMPYLRLKKAGKDILLTAVMDPSKASLLKSKGLEVSDPIKSLRRLQHDISHDFFIVVMQTNKGTVDKWMAQLTGVDVVILGQQRGVQKKAEKLHGAQLLYNCNRGKTVSALEVSRLTGKKSLKTPENFLLRASDFSEDAQVASMVKEFEVWLHAYHAERQKNILKTKGPANASKGGLPAIFQRLIEQNKSKKNHSTSFIGVQRCAECHKEKFVLWKKTRHARAMATLAAKHRENDPDCFRCHVTGMVGVGVNQTVAAGQKENPFAKLIQRQQGNHLPDVQCEVCHGSGTRHAAKPGKETKMIIPGDQDCRQCHTLDTDPDFSFRKKKELICK